MDGDGDAHLLEGGPQVGDGGGDLLAVEQEEPGEHHLHPHASVPLQPGLVRTWEGHPRTTMCRQGQGTTAPACRGRSRPGTPWGPSRGPPPSPCPRLVLAAERLPAEGGGQGGQIGD